MADWEISIVGLIPGVLACCLVSSFVLVLAHVACERSLLRRRPHLSPQLILIRLSLASNPLLLIGTLQVVLRQTGLASMEQFSAVVYSLLLFNCFAYAYFHLFNLSETGRRIRMLVSIAYPHSGGGMPVQGYSVVDMVSARLARLQSMGQIKVEEGRCEINGRTFLLIGRFLRVIGRLFIGKNRQ